MTKEEIFKKVNEIVAKTLCIEPEIVRRSYNFQELGVDNLDIVEMVSALEEEFGIEIPDEVAEKINAVEGLVDCINESIASL